MRRLLLCSIAVTGLACEPDPDPDPTPPQAGLEELPTAACAEVGDGPYTPRDAVDFHAPLPERDVPFTLDYTMGGGAGVIDVTGDDRPDLILTAVWGDNALFRNTGDGFERCANSGIELGTTYGASAVDLDDDGLREIVLLDAGAVRLFRNEGGCRFTEVDPIATFADPLQRPMNAAWADFDGDGRVDVYVGVRNADPFADGVDRPGRDLLLRGEGSLRFRDVSVLLGSAVERSGHAFASAWIDVDRDGDLDHYVANDHGREQTPNRLFLRRGTGDAPEEGFEEASAELGLDVPINGMGLAIGDVDGDGWDEIGISDTADFVVVSTRDGAPAVDVTAAWGLVPRRGTGLASWSMEFADLDHDVDLDLLVSWGWKDYVSEGLQRDDLWVRDGDTYVDRGHLLTAEPNETGRTLLPVDLDGDGGLELISTPLIGSPSIQSRPCPAGAWIEVGVRGPSGNPSALGALVEIEAGGVTQRRRIGIGSTSVSSAREPVAHFGLGDAEVVDRIRVTWPRGDVAEATDVPARRRLRVAR